MRTIVGRMILLVGVVTLGAGIAAVVLVDRFDIRVTRYPTYAAMAAAESGSRKFDLRLVPRSATSIVLVWNLDTAESCDSFDADPSSLPELLGVLRSRGYESSGSITLPRQQIGLLTRCPYAPDEVAGADVRLRDPRGGDPRSFVAISYRLGRVYWWSAYEYPDA